MLYHTVKSQFVKIGELCKQAGVSRETIRHYESLGLIYADHLPAGSRFYRDYNEKTLLRLRHIEKGKSLGLTLRELKLLLDLYDDKGIEQEEQSRILTERIEKIESVIEDAVRIRDELKLRLKSLEETGSACLNQISGSI